MKPDKTPPAAPQDERLVLLKSYARLVIELCDAPRMTLGQRSLALRDIDARMSELVADYGSVPDAFRRRR